MIGAGAVVSRDDDVVRAVEGHRGNHVAGGSALGERGRLEPRRQLVARALGTLVAFCGKCDACGTRQQQLTPAKTDQSNGLARTWRNPHG
jgi:hypothetical protein